MHSWRIQVNIGLGTSEKAGEARQRRGLRLKRRTGPRELQDYQAVCSWASQGSFLGADYSVGLLAVLQGV